MRKGMPRLERLLYKSFSEMIKVEFVCVYYSSGDLPCGIKESEGTRPMSILGYYFRFGGFKRPVEREWSAKSDYNLTAIYIAHAIVV